MSELSAVVLGHLPATETAPATDLDAVTSTTASTERPEQNWTPVIVN